ncbi:DUF1993 domain-containing protein [Luteimonas sp. RD2P54]|uniref:DUF1993 domain-containing protein n=1 Tax=Luteimonas endophytica TaxID=3042023 RepID=A0ABT6J8J7_9GAMM|nr:DUF1993 domain-containing protein [Luteimonas endophytica]MDH5823084.1 DUF1993 domain-containing protein [Luteimonas endophytica]
MAAPLSMYQASVPVFSRMLGNLAHLLRRGMAHARATGTAEALLDARLAPDMYPLLRQVQIATDLACGGAARLAGAEPEPIADTEADFDALLARIVRARACLEGFGPERIDGSEDRPISIHVPTGGALDFDGSGYLTGFVLPNLYFHVCMAYAILRNQGVALGKLDYFGVEAPAPASD